MFMYTPLQILKLFIDDELLKVDEYPQLKNNGRMSVEACEFYANQEILFA